MSQSALFLPFEEARQALIDDNTPCVESETVPLKLAHQRVIAEPIIADINVPSYNNSAMDGYAFNFNDLSVYSKFKLIGTAFAGNAYSGQWQQGSCIRIMTGAPIPAGFDTVVMQEQAVVNTTAHGDFIAFNNAPKQAQNVRCCGEDITKGDTLFAKGHRLKAADVGMLASLGIASVNVYKPLKVAILSTGDEIFEPGCQRANEGIFDSNRYSSASVLHNLGFEVLDFGIINDDPNALQTAFEQAIDNADVVISSGGVSVGEADHTKAVLTQLGTMQFWKVAIKPGKPFAYGHFEKRSEHNYAKRFMGLPGNPVSSLVTLHQLALPALRKMAGESITAIANLHLPLAHAVSKKTGRTEFMRATLTHTETGTVVTPLKGQGSGVLSTFSKSTGYLILDASQSQWQSGDIVAFQPFDIALN